MWTILESRSVQKIAPTLQPEIRKKYELWKSIVRFSGPSGLRAIKGFRDEALAGDWKGYRSSRLNDQWRVIYRTEGAAVLVEVERITPHDYRR